MYPLNMTKTAVGQVAAGFAVANDADEHRALTGHGYGPALVEAAKPAEDPAPEDGKAVSEKDAVMAALDASGIEYDRRLGLAKLKALLPA